MKRNRNGIIMRRVAMLTFASALGATPLLADGITLDLDDNGGLSLEKAMDMAEQHAFSAKISQDTADEAEARAKQTRGQLLPKIGLESNQTWIDKHTNALAGHNILGTRFPDRISNLAVMATQPIVGLGALSQKWRGDDLNAASAREESRQGVNDARLSGADAYLRALKAVRIARIAKASADLIDKELNEAKQQEAQGRLAALDVKRLALAQAEARTALLQANVSVTVAALALVEALGLAEGEKRIVLHATASSLWEQHHPSLPSSDQVVAQAIRERPDVIAAAKRAEASQAYRNASMFDYLPTVNGFVRYERDFTAKDVNAPVLGSNDTVHYDKNDIRDNYSYGLMMNWTIWDWGTRRNRVREMSATVAKAQHAEEATQSRAQLEVTQAYEELRFASEALTSARTSMDFAEDVYKATDTKFKNGLATSTDLITAERDQTRARANLANAQGDVDIAWLKLQRATGQKVAFRAR